MSSYGQANIGGGDGDYRLIILIIIIIRCSILLNNQTYTHTYTEKLTQCRFQSRICLIKSTSLYRYNTNVLHTYIFI